MFSMSVKVTRPNELSCGSLLTTADVERQLGEDEPALVLSELEQLSEDAVEASIAEELTKILPLLKGEN